ncbi:hypothetical protein BV20DRAFT_905515, partial [Pilatotrama ljubarskyi]
LPPSILLALIIIGALHTLSGVQGNAVNLILGMVRIVLTGAFIASNKAASLQADSSQSMLDAIPRDILTVLAHLQVEPDYIRYATC